LINRGDRWPGLDLRHLAALEAVARTASFAKAAVELGYTQPAVSQQIAALERIVGTRLFERGSGPKPVTLTAAGELLLRHVEVIQARLAAAQADLEALVAGESGTLRIGTFQSVAARVLPPLVQRFSQEWPDVEIRLTERDDDMDLLGFVESGELDLAFVMLPVPDGPFEAVEVVSDEYLLLSHPDAALDCVADLRGVPLIGFRQCRSHSLLEDALRRLGCEPNVVFRSDDNGTVQSFVATGMGAAVMPRLAVDMDDARVHIAPLDELEPRRIGVVWHCDRWRAPALDAFVGLALGAESGVESRRVA
jgi:DNA-binding transcriptional LysR family regulator